MPPRSPSAAGEHRVVDRGLELAHHDFAVVALELDHAVLGRAADAAALLQPPGELAHARVVEWEVVNGGDRLASAPGRLPADLRRLRLGQGADASHSCTSA